MAARKVTIEELRKLINDTINEEVSDVVKRKSERPLEQLAQSIETALSQTSEVFEATNDDTAYDDLARLVVTLKHAASQASALKKKIKG